MEKFDRIKLKSRSRGELYNFVVCWKKVQAPYLYKRTIKVSTRVTETIFSAWNSETNNFFVFWTLWNSFEASRKLKKTIFREIYPEAESTRNDLSDIRGYKKGSSLAVILDLAVSISSEGVRLLSRDFLLLRMIRGEQENSSTPLRFFRILSEGEVISCKLLSCKSLLPLPLAVCLTLRCRDLPRNASKLSEIPTFCRSWYWLR